MPDQIMTDIPEYRQSKNAPSQSAIDEAYKRGIYEAFMIWHEQRALLDSCRIEFSEFVDNMDEGFDKLMNKSKLNHHHGDE